MYFTEITIAAGAVMLWLASVCLVQRMVRLELQAMMSALLEVLDNRPPLVPEQPENKEELQEQSKFVTAPGSVTLEELDERTRSLVHLVKMNHEDISLVMNHLSKKASKKPAKKAAINPVIKPVKKQDKTSTKQNHMSEKTKKNGSSATCN
jgi:hypothetical protein